mgnify:FL=1
MSVKLVLAVVLMVALIVLFTISLYYLINMFDIVRRTHEVSEASVYDKLVVLSGLACEFLISVSLFTLFTLMALALVVVFLELMCDCFTS